MPYDSQYNTTQCYPPPQYDYSPTSHEMSHDLSRSSHSSGSSGSSRSSYVGGYPEIPYNYKQLQQIDFQVGEPVGSKIKSKRSSSNNSVGGAQPSYHCFEDGCDYQSPRQYDLKRHVNVHSKLNTYPCQYDWCGRNEENPFNRRDHLDVHVRTVHMKENPRGVKTKSGGKSKSQSGH